MRREGRRRTPTQALRLHGTPADSIRARSGGTIAAAVSDGQSYRDHRHLLALTRDGCLVSVQLMKVSTGGRPEGCQGRALSGVARDLLGIIALVRGTAAAPKEMGAGIAASPHCAERRICRCSQLGPLVPEGLAVPALDPGSPAQASLPIWHLSLSRSLADLPDYVARKLAGRSIGLAWKEP